MKPIYSYWYIDLIYTTVMSTSTSGTTTASGSVNNSIVIGVTVGVIIAIVVTTLLIIVCLIIMYRRKKHSVTYPVTCPSSGYYSNVAIIVSCYSVFIQSHASVEIVSWVLTQKFSYPCIGLKLVTWMWLAWFKIIPGHSFPT